MSSRSRVLSLTRTDLEVAAKDGEQLLLALVLPVLLLVFFSQVDVLDITTTDAARTPIDFLTPGILTLALLSASFVRLAISLGFDRGFGAIKRLAVTPLTAGEFFVAKLLSTVAVFALQLCVLCGLAGLLGWSPSFHPTLPLVFVGGLITFCGLAVALSSVVEGLRSLALANTIYIVLLLLSGLIFELDRLPGWLQAGAKLLPSTATAAIVRAGFNGFAGPSWAWIVMAVWALASPALAVTLFRWE